MPIYGLCSQSFRKVSSRELTRKKVNQYSPPSFETQYQNNINADLVSAGASVTERSELRVPTGMEGKNDNLYDRQCMGSCQESKFMAKVFKS